MTSPRRFAVHEASEDRARGRTVDAVSFEDAALAFLERWHPETAPGQDDVTLIVTECDTGREHCLRVDPGSGDSAPCD